MRSQIRKLYTKYIQPKAIVLMYHRIAEPEADIWEVAVSPQNFEQQLQVLNQHYKVVSINDLYDAIRSGHLNNKNCVAITFDDGYADNYENAMPLLQKYNLPATFFISTANTDKDEAFWWDELEHILLFSDTLPPSFSITLNGTSINFDLGSEATLDQNQKQKNKHWKACTDTPPTLRCALYLELWRKLKPLEVAEQNFHLQKIRNWANSSTLTNSKNKSMSSGQLQDLAKNSLFTMGAHTVSHPALGLHDIAYQSLELKDNKRHLETLTGNKIRFLAYPYGNYNHDTVIATKNEGFEAAFTTEEKVVTSRSDFYRLGRFQVKNVGAPAFKRALEKWRYKI
ncbi:polysaccharide deacetylase family protein [Pontibacter sp. MBLB2868]|uniref:polysaccharide deacetylase family protein n=1 Tax=Pontibacter sp. MBLB2868 TaxID=3451555 RepID=UPI003F74BF4D